MPIETRAQNNKPLLNPRSTQGSQITLRGDTALGATEVLSAGTGGRPGCLSPRCVRSRGGPRSCGARAAPPAAPGWG
eukprot:scaffold72916_cov67-Phaeocystis_antarctica.AAC.9